MADDRPKSGNPDLIKQHKKIQHEGDRDLAGTSQEDPQSGSRKSETERKKEERDSDNSGSRSNGGSFVGP
jgi:hypothetical protein